MKFSCQKEDIFPILNQIVKAVAVKPSTPALSGIYLRVSDGELEIQANSYTLGMSAKISVDSTLNGEMVVIGKKFLDVIRALPDDTLFFSREIGSGYLEISSGKSTYSIATFKVDEFPKVTQNDPESAFTIESRVLKMLINKTVFACAKEEIYPIYTGCLFVIKEGKIDVAATNMHRLAVSTATLRSTSKPMRFIVSGEILRTISEMLPDDESTITIEYYGKNVAFDIDQIFVKARLIDGTYPDYQRVIPTSSSTFIDVDVAMLREAVERLSIISREDPNKKITFNLKRTEMEIVAASNEVGNGNETVPIKLDGAEITISFSYVYILDVLKILRDGTCKISLNGEFDAADIRSKDDSNFIYVVTPVRG